VWGGGEGPERVHVVPVYLCYVVGSLSLHVGRGGRGGGGVHHLRGQLRVDRGVRRGSNVLAIDSGLFHQHTAMARQQALKEWGVFQGWGRVFAVAQQWAQMPRQL
jgi:hypothetical protein